MAVSKPNSRRNADLALIHMAAKNLFGDVTKTGDGRGDYEDWLERNTGKRSAAKLTPQERADLVAHIRKQGLVKNRVPGGQGKAVNGRSRPTSKQWLKLAALARAKGWQDGLEDGRLQGFVERTAKISSTRFLTASQASDVITALDKWAKAPHQKAFKEQVGGVS